MSLMVFLAAKDVKTKKIRCYFKLIMQMAEQICKPLYDSQTLGFKLSLETKEMTKKSTVRIFVPQTLMNKIVLWGRKHRKHMKSQLWIKAPALYSASFSIMVT
jgi:hypothetical protein